MTTDLRDRILTTALSRRRLLQLTGTAGATLMAGSLLAACGGGDDDDDDTPATTGTDSGAATATTAPEEGDASPTSGDSEGGETPAAGADAGEGVMGGTMLAAMQTSPPSLDFMSNTTAQTRVVARPTIEPLITYLEDFTVGPMLAEAWEASDDGLTYTFTLRQNVPFHDGRIVTTEDVVASMDRYMEVTTRKPEFEIVDSYEATDDTTITFTLNTATLGFLDSMAYPLAYPGVIPADVAGSITDTNVEVSHMVGTGPYKMVEWLPDQEVRYEKFADYASRDEDRSGIGGGKIAYFDEIIMRTVPEAGARVAGLEAGEFHYADGLPTTDFDRLDENAETTPYINEFSNLAVVYFNSSDPISGNLQFRQAIQAGIRSEEIALSITNGREEFFLMDPSFFFPPTPWHSEAGAEVYNQADTEKAKQLLEESGYAGEEIILLTNRNYDFMYKTIVTLEEYMKSELEITTKVEVLDWPGQVERVDQPTGWHIAPTSFVSAPTFGPAGWAQFWATGASSWGYSNPEMDAAFDAFAAAATQEERLEIAQDLQRLCHETAHMVKIANTFSLAATRAEVKNFVPWYEPRFWSVWIEE